MSSIKVKKGWKVEPSGSRSSETSSPSSSFSSSFLIAWDCARIGSSKCGDGRRARPVEGLWVLVPLVLRREDFEGEEEWDGMCLGRDILREGRGLHGELHGEVEGEEGNRASSRQTAASGWSRDHVTATVNILRLRAKAAVL